MMNDGKTKTTSRLLALLLALFMILLFTDPECPLLAEAMKETSESREPAKMTVAAETEEMTDEQTEVNEGSQKPGMWQKDYYSELPVVNDALIQKLIDNNLAAQKNGVSFKAHISFAAELLMGDPGVEGEFGMTMPILFDMPFELRLTRERNFELNLKLALAMMGQEQDMSMTVYMIDHPTDPDRLQMVMVSDQGSGPIYHISEVERAEMDEYMDVSRESSMMRLDQLKEFSDYRVLDEGEATTKLMLLISPEQFLRYASEVISDSELETDPEALASAGEAIESLEALEEAMESAIDLESFVIPIEIEIETDTALLRGFELKAEGLKEFTSLDLSELVESDEATGKLDPMSFELKKFEFALDSLNYDVLEKIELPQALRAEIEKTAAVESTLDEDNTSAKNSTETDEPASADRATTDSSNAVLPQDAVRPDETDVLLSQGILFDHENKTLYDERAVYEMVKDIRPVFFFEKPAEGLVAAEGEEDEDGVIIEIVGDRILVTVENTTPYPIADLSFKGKSEATGEMVSFYFQDYTLLPGEKAAYQVVEATTAANRVESAEDFILDELTVSFRDAEDHVSRVIYNADTAKITGSSGSGTDFDVLKKQGPFDPASFVLELGVDTANQNLIYTVKNNSDLAVVYFELLMTTEDLSSSTFYCSEVLLPGNGSSTQESYPVNPITKLNDLKPRFLRVTLNENGKEINVFYDYGLRRFIIR